MKFKAKKTLKKLTNNKNIDFGKYNKQKQIKNHCNFSQINKRGDKIGLELI